MHRHQGKMQTILMTGGTYSQLCLPILMTGSKPSGLDFDRDEKACPECRSNAVKTVDELVDEQCPVCEEETSIAKDTGAIA